MEEGHDSFGSFSTWLLSLFIINSTWGMGKSRLFFIITFPPRVKGVRKDNDWAEICLSDFVLSIDFERNCSLSYVVERR